MLNSARRTTIWLGLDEDQPDDEDLRMNIHTEDDMVAIEAIDSNGDPLEVFIQPQLFSRIREVMDIIEGRGKLCTVMTRP